MDTELKDAQVQVKVNLDSDKPIEISLEVMHGVTTNMFMNIEAATEFSQKINNAILAYRTATKKA